MADDDTPQLSAHTLAALQEFLSEQKQVPTEKDGVAFVPPNWGLSQFWYTTETAGRVATEAIRRAKGGRVACLCTPSAFRALVAHGHSDAYLLEFDERFSVFGDNFVKYDLYSPLDLPSQFKGTVDCFLIDPPHLNRDALRNCNETVRWMARDPSAPAVILLTGAVMEDAAKEFFGARRTKWVPTHDDAIQNPFACFVTGDAEGFDGWEVEA
eukprot:TRINITY_DN1150_c0_g1_i1.p1 TRINITY_DN1150_c0_g1~~TRINITY_DN1150_c0_g1_i1.p1  ORF type:complete len:221 (+),score=33.28 TRINITY_DN1150_c0_g1_i1:28-663(+)